MFIPVLSAYSYTNIMRNKHGVLECKVKLWGLGVAAGGNE